MLGCSEHFTGGWIGIDCQRGYLTELQVGSIESQTVPRRRATRISIRGAEFETPQAASTSAASIRHSSVFTVQRSGRVSFSWVPRKCNSSIDFQVDKWKGNYCGVRQWKTGLWDILNHVWMRSQSGSFALGTASVLHGRDFTRLHHVSQDLSIVHLCCECPGLSNPKRGCVGSRSGD